MAEYEFKRKLVLFVFNNPAHGIYENQDVTPLSNPEWITCSMAQYLELKGIINILDERSELSPIINQGQLAFKQPKRF